MQRIFISVAGEDKHFAEAVKRILENVNAFEQRSVWEAFYYPTDTGQTPDWQQTLYEKIRELQPRSEVLSRFDYFLVIVTEHYTQRPACIAELGAASGLRKDILFFRPLATSPVTTDPSQLHSANQEILLEECARDDNDRHQTTIEVGGESKTYRLSGAARRSLGQLRDEGAIVSADEFPAAVEDDLKTPIPFKGLRSLDMEDAGIFYGRDDDIKDALSQIDQMVQKHSSAVFLIQGPSGVGKSSFMKAGLLARMDRSRKKYVVLPPAPYDTDRPYSQFGVWIDNVVRDAGNEFNFGGDFLKVQPTKVAAYIRHLYDKDTQFDAGRPIFIPMDQTEGFILEAAGSSLSLPDRKRQEREEEIESFLSAVSKFLSAADRVYFIATVREEYASRLMERLSSKQVPFFLGALDDEQIGEVIERPLKRQEFRGRQFSEKAVARLKVLARKQPDKDSRLPLLADALSRLWAENKAAARSIEIPDDFELDSLFQGAIAEAMETLKGSRTEEELERELREFFFERFIEPVERPESEAESKSGVSFRPCEESELASSPRQFEIAEEFSRRRILVGFEMRKQTGKTVAAYRIGHPSVAEKWRLLKEWIESQRKTIELIGRIRTDAERWVKKGEDVREAVLRPSDFDELRQICGSLAPVGGPAAISKIVRDRLKLRLTDTEARFVAKCYEHYEALERSQEERVSSETQPLQAEIANMALERSKLQGVLDHEKGAAATALANAENRYRVALQRIEQKLQSLKRTANRFYDALLLRRSKMRGHARWLIGFRRVAIFSTVALVVTGTGWYWTSSRADENKMAAVDRARAEGQQLGEENVRSSAAAELVADIAGCWSVIQPQRAACYQFQVTTNDSALQARCMFDGAPTLAGAYTTDGTGLIVQVQNRDILSRPRSWSFTSGGEYLLWRETTDDGQPTRETIVARRTSC